LLLNMFAVAHIVIVWLTNLHLIGLHCWVVVEFDRAHIKSSDVGHTEEATVPFSEQVDSFIVFEYILVFVDICWLNGVKISNYVSSIECGEYGWRVESVVV
jgi:hypothetical protein